MELVQIGAVQLNLAILMAGVGIIAGVWSNYRLRVMNNLYQRQLEDLRSELLSNSSSSVGMGRKILELEKRLQSSLTKQEEQQQGYSPYSRATDMLGSGADINDVIKNCGISRAEAELMQLMHRQMRRYGPTHK